MNIFRSNDLPSALDAVSSLQAASKKRFNLQAQAQDFVNNDVNLAFDVLHGQLEQGALEPSFYVNVPIPPQKSDEFRLLVCQILAMKGYSVALTGDTLHIGASEGSAGKLLGQNMECAPYNTIIMVKRWDSKPFCFSGHTSCCEVLTRTKENLWVTPAGEEFSFGDGMKAKDFCWKLPDVTP